MKNKTRSKRLLIGAAAVILAAGVITAPAMAGPEAKLTGLPIWDTGRTGPGQEISTTGGSWTVHGSPDGTEDIDIRVTSTGDWTASEDGTSGVNRFVVREFGTGKLITGTYSRLISGLQSGQTYSFDLWCKMPLLGEPVPPGAEAGEHHLIVQVRPSGWVVNPTPCEAAGGIEIGTQCWAKKNLDHDNGCTNATWNNREYSAWCGYYNGIDYGEGLLYQWRAAMNGSSTEGARGLCPAGWHIPTDAEWCTLEEYLGCSNPCGSTDWRCDGVGAALKPGGSSGFEALMPGMRNYQGAFSSRGSSALFWSSTRNRWNYYMGRHVLLYYSTLDRREHYTSLSYSVRCLKD